jgi:hypothetical protein
MRRHHSEVHGLTEASNSSPFVRPAKLQTFFRGTKIRYFEVTPSPDLWYTSAPDDDRGDDDDGPNETMPGASTATVPPPPFPPVSDASTSSAGNLNLETLTYFHHFTTTTSLTLPSDHQQLSIRYWQADFVQLALQRQWLMYGLLAMSACHLAILADDPQAKALHRKRSVQFFSEFKVQGVEMTLPDEYPSGVSTHEDIKNAARKIERLVHCAHWASAEWWLDQENISVQAVASHLQTAVGIIRDLVGTEPATDAASTWRGGTHRQQEIFAQTSRILRMRISSSTSSSDALPSTSDTPATLFNRLATLPSRMTEAFGRPGSNRGISEDVEDVFVMLSATASLIECCDIAFASDEAGAALGAMAAWWTKVPDHFNVLVSQNSPAALVVLAHWATSLVRRAENCGCWFLGGAATAILCLVKYQLPADNLAMQGLVAGLV